MPSRRRTPRLLALLVVLTAISIAGCRQSVRLPDLGGIYNEAAMTADHTRNPIIVIPGILGSRLIEESSDKVIWGAFGPGVADPASDDGARMVALPIDRPGELDGVISPPDVDEGSESRWAGRGVLDRLHVSLWGVALEQRAYIQILGTLGVGGYRDEQLSAAGVIDYGTDHFTCFQFAYDWRRDLAENAQRLREFILRKRKFVAEKLGKPESEVKFDIAAHSMGGLVTRYLLRYGGQELPADGSLPELTWEGANYVDRAILIGTPSAGSVYAIQQLVDGYKPAPLLPNYSQALLGTMPAIYQLMPRPRHLPLQDEDGDTALSAGLYDVEQWERLGWGLLDPSEKNVLKQLLPGVESAEERRAIARSYVDLCLRRADQFHRALDVPSKPPRNLGLYLFAGDAIQTLGSLEVDEKNGNISDGRFVPGDNVVPRSSALMDERVGSTFQHDALKSPIRWKGVHFLFTDHLGLTSDPTFTDNILYILLEEPRDLD